jgi:hypothetical protein
MTLEFETMTPAGKFGDTCETAIMDLRPLVPDDVLRNIPRFLGRWEDDENMRILLDDNWNIETASDDCDYSVASRETLECSVILPNQQLIAIGFDNILYTQMMQKFCDAQSIFKFPTLFLANGEFDTGQELSDLFIEFILAELRGPFMKHLRDVFWNGSQATRHSLQGVLTQLDSGQFTVGDACDAYTHVEFDWNTIVGGSGARSNPAATITAGNDSQTIHGHTFTGLAGLNMVEFMRLWLERLLEYELAKWSDEMMEWELWVGQGQTTAIAELAACMQPCDGCVNPMSDPVIRERAADFRKNKVIWLYPYDNISITIRTSQELDGQMMLVPKTIGGRPMIGFVFRDQVEQLGILNGELPYYGARGGLVDANYLYPEDEVMDEATLFESRAFTVNVQKNGNCLNVWLNTEAAVVLMGLHVWLRFQNVDSVTLTPAVVEQVLGVTASACVDSGGNNLQWTVAALEDYGDVTAGDTYRVYFEDTFTQLTGIVVSYDTGTDALILNMGADLDCTYGGGAANAVIVKHADNTP